MAVQDECYVIHDIRYPVIAEQKLFDNRPFPLVVSPSFDHQSLSTEHWITWVKTHSVKLKQLLLDHGALLFRDFPLDNASDFDNFTKQFGYEPFPYVGGAAARQFVVGNVFTANEAPSDSTIPYHHEMAQVPNFPACLFFYCDVVPAADGETPLVLSNVAHRLISERDRGFVVRLETEGVRYIRVAPDGDDVTSAIGRGWQSTFQTEDRAEAEAQATSQGTEFEWMGDGSMKTVTKVLPATRVDERTGKMTWFNSIIAAYVGWNDSRNEGKRAVVFGSSGDVMPEEAMKIVLDTMNELAVAVPWKKGDVIMVDNRQVLHSRRPFTPPRRILAALYKD